MGGAALPAFGCELSMEVSPSVRAYWVMLREVCPCPLTAVIQGVDIWHEGIWQDSWSAQQDHNIPEGNSLLSW